MYGACGLPYFVEGRVREAKDLQQLKAVIEHAGDPLDDRQAEAEPARHLGALIEPVEFTENLPLF